MAVVVVVVIVSLEVVNGARERIVARCLPFALSGVEVTAARVISPPLLGFSASPLSKAKPNLTKGMDRGKYSDFELGATRILEFEFKPRRLQLEEETRKASMLCKSKLLETCPTCPSVGLPLRPALRHLWLDEKLLLLLLLSFCRSL